MQLITCKFSTKCATSGKPIKKGDFMYYDRDTKKCYHEKHRPDGDSVAGFIQAQEDAYFDNFCQQNNI